MNKIERKIYNNHQLKNDDDSTAIFTCALGVSRPYEYTSNINIRFDCRTPVIPPELLGMITDYTQKIANGASLVYELEHKLQHAKLDIEFIGSRDFYHPAGTFTYFYVDGILNPNYPQIGTGVAMIALEPDSAIEHGQDECKKFAQEIYALCDRWVPPKPNPDEEYQPSLDDLLDFDNMALRNKYGSMLKSYLYTSQTMEYSSYEK